MSNVFNFNNYNLSTREVIRYAENGIIDAIPSDVFMKIIKEYQSQIEKPRVNLPTKITKQVMMTAGKPLLKR